MKEMKLEMIDLQLEEFLLQICQVTHRSGNKIAEIKSFQTYAI